MSKVTMFAGINTSGIRTRAAMEYLYVHGHRSDMVYTTQDRLGKSIIHTASEMIKDGVDVVIEGDFQRRNEREKVLQQFKDAGYETMIVTHSANLGDLDLNEADSIMTLPETP